MSPRGPYCWTCGHEYRSKTGTPEVFTGACPYCGTAAQPSPVKPFHEFSKSQIEKWGMPGDENGCPARYFFKYVLHLPEPKNEYAEFGIFGHELGEKWMLSGEYPQVNSLDPKSTPSRAAMSLLGGIPHMPPRDLPGLTIESEFHYDFEGIRYMGYKDVWAPLTPATPGPPDRMRFGSSLAGDWKFVGQKSFTTYTPTSEKLATDLQATIEAYDDVRRGAASVYLNWVYMPRGERNGKPVRVWVHAPQVVARMREINTVAREILHVLQSGTKDPRAMRTNSRACKAYGKPCPYLDRCHVSGQDRLSASFANLHQTPEGQKEGTLMTQPTMPGAPGGLAALVGQINGTGAPPQAPPFMPQPAAAPPGMIAQPAPAAGQFPPQAAPAAPPPAPPPAPTPQPTDQYNVAWNGQNYVIPYSQLAGAIGAGATVIGPVTPAAPQAPPVAAQAPAQPAPAAAASPPAPAARATRGRRPRAAAPTPAPAAAQAPAPVAQPQDTIAPAALLDHTANAITEADDGAYDDLVVDAIEALNQTLAGMVRLIEVLVSRK